LSSQRRPFLPQGFAAEHPALDPNGGKLVVFDDDVLALADLVAFDLGFDRRAGAPG
jgi:hypothetical protein